MWSDLNAFFDRLAAEDNRLYRHTVEGPDDMPAHIRAALTLTQLSIPVQQGRMALGTWQAFTFLNTARRPTAGTWCCTFLRTVTGGPTAKRGGRRGRYSSGESCADAAQEPRILKRAFGRSGRDNLAPQGVFGGDSLSSNPPGTGPL